MNLIKYYKYNRTLYRANRELLSCQSNWNFSPFSYSSCHKCSDRGYNLAARKRMNTIRFAASKLSQAHRICQICSKTKVASPSSPSTKTWRHPTPLALRQICCVIRKGNRLRIERSNIFLWQACSCLSLSLCVFFIHFYGGTKFLLTWPHSYAANAVI